MSEHRVLHVESPATIRLDTGRLRIEAQGREPYFTATEDVAVLSIADPRVTITGQALQALVEAGATVIVADRRRLPAALLAPTNGNVSLAARQRRQAEWLLGEAEDAERVWRAIVRAKLRMQAALLDRLGRDGALRLERLARRMEGDPARAEAQGSRHYWPRLFGDGFRREKRGAEDARNARLNYGYAVLRALVARALAAAGFALALGVRHRGPTNPFNLADDWMEPFRPWVDAIVAAQPEDAALTPERKRELFGVAAACARMSDGRVYRLPAALDAMAAAFWRRVERGRGALLLPDGFADGLE